MATLERATIYVPLDLQRAVEKAAKLDQRSYSGFVVAVLSRNPAVRKQLNEQRAKQNETSAA
jgi:uncharacterized protein (DUF1778 family)